MLNATQFGSASHHRSDNAVCRELPCVYIRLLAKPISPSTREKCVIGVIHNANVEHTFRTAYLPKLGQVRQKTSMFT